MTASISSFGEILKRDVATIMGESLFAQVNHMLVSDKHISKNTYCFLRNINNMALIAQMKSKQVSIEPINLSSLISSICEATNRHSKKTIVCLMQEKGILVNANSYLLTHSIFEAIRNAIQFNRSNNEGAITLSLTSDGGNVAVCISDCGIGMTDKYRSSVFTPFFVIDSTKCIDGSSLGLGLTMVNYLAVYLGGHVTFDSVSDEGSVLRLILPRHQPTPDDKIETLTKYTADELIKDRLSPLYLHLCG